MWAILLLPLLVVAQDPAENADNFRKLYGIATKIMEISGNFMGQGQGGGFDNEVRPRFQDSSRSFNEDNSINSGLSSNDKFASMARMFSEYGGLLNNARIVTTTTTTTTPRPQNGFQSLLNTFLGSAAGSGGESSDDSDSLPPPPTPRPRQKQNLFSGGNSPSRTNPMPEVGDKETRNLISNFFGLMPTTTTTTTTEAPVQKIINMFVPPQESSAKSPSKGAFNFMELFGVTSRPTTTTQAPLQALLNPNKPFTGGAEDIDGIMNALMRTGARPARQESGSLLSQFFGGR